MTEVSLDVDVVEVDIEVSPGTLELTVAPVVAELNIAPLNSIEIDVTTGPVVELYAVPVTVDVTFNPPPVVNILVGDSVGGSGSCYVPNGGTPTQVLSKRTGADFDTVWAEPGVNTYRTPFDWPLPTTPRHGDLWYDADNNNTPYRWDGTAWIDIHDLGIDLAVAIAEGNTDDISDNSGAIELLNQQINELYISADSAEKAANTADGRVSMSDYEPTPDDVTYPVVSTDPDTGEPEVIQVPRVEGSLWFQRTRPRKNLVSNPSFEKNATGWQSTDCAIARVDPAAIAVPAGFYCLQVTNAGSGNPHVETTYTFAADESEWYAASAFFQLVSGSGVGCYTMFTFYDSGGAIISTFDDDGEDLVQPPVSDDNWNRINLVIQAPPGATSFRVHFHNPNPGDVWYLSEVIVENLAELGKYFDGDSYDGFWEGGTGDPLHDSSQNPVQGQVGWQESTSRLYGDKIIGIWELHSATWVRKYLTDDTLGMIDARKLTNLDQLQLAPNSISIDKMDGPVVTTSEALSAGDVVNIYNAGNGLFRVRRANAAAGSNFQATGFVLDDVASGAPARVYQAGTDLRRIAMAPGPKWLAETPGAITNVPPNTTGCTVQQVGTAADMFYLIFAPLSPIRII